MPLLFWLLPGGFLIWLFAQRHAEARLAREKQITGAYYPFPRPPHEAAGFFERHEPPRRQLAPARREEPLSRGVLRARVVTTADYLQHLHEASVAAQILDLVKSPALAADIVTLMQAPSEVVEAFHVLGAPLDVLFAQKDLNVLGATPPLREDGVPSAETRQALKAFQARFGQSPTGEMDSGTAASIRYAVGCINSQDRAHLAAVVPPQTGT
jgi:hypothetical protein